MLKSMHSTDEYAYDFVLCVVVRVIQTISNFKPEILHKIKYNIGSLG